MLGWSALSGFAAAVLAFLSVAGPPRHRTALRAGTILSLLICAGLLYGPPFDKIAGGIILALLVMVAGLVALRGA